MSSGNAPPHKWLLWGGTLPDDTKNGGEADWQVTAILKLSLKCNKTQFKRQKFSCNELTTHLGQPKWHRFNSWFKHWAFSKGKCFIDILWNSPNWVLKEIYEDQSEDFVCGYQGANIGLFFNSQGSFCHLSLVVVPSCHNLSPGQTRYYLMDWGWNTKIIQQAQ